MRINANSVFTINQNREVMSTLIRKLFEAMDGASEQELIRFSGHSFKPNGDSRIWPADLAKKYSKAKARLKTAKSAFRNGVGSKASVERNERELAEVVREAKANWLEGRKWLPRKAKVNRRDRGQAKLISSAKSRFPTADVNNSIERGGSPGVIAFRVRQLERLDLQSSILLQRVEELIKADLAILPGTSGAIGFYADNGHVEAIDYERAQANAHVIARTIYFQKERRSAGVSGKRLRRVKRSSFSVTSANTQTPSSSAFGRRLNDIERDPALAAEAAEIARSAAIERLDRAYGKDRIRFTGVFVRSGPDAYDDDPRTIEKRKQHARMLEKTKR